VEEARQRRREKARQRRAEEAKQKRSENKHKDADGAKSNGTASPVKSKSDSTKHRPDSLKLASGEQHKKPANGHHSAGGDGSSGRHRKAEKRRQSSQGGDLYVEQGASDLKIRIKSPSPTRRQDSGGCGDQVAKRQRSDSQPRQRHPSEMAAFLPERQLWDWDGRGVKRGPSKGKAKRVVYTTIRRGRETITVGDCAVFLSAGLPDRPYVGRVQALWEATSGQMLVQVAWFYHPEETCALSQPLPEPHGALFESPHMDDNDVQTISHRCSVTSLDTYRRAAESGGDNETFYRAGYYDPRKMKIKVDEAVLAEAR